METTIYDVDYFIRKFEAIPDIMWCVGVRTDGEGKHCALGHVEYNEGMKKLVDIFRLMFSDVPGSSGSVSIINNGEHPKYQQPTPKQRILAALYDIRAKQQPAEPKEKIIYKTVVIDTAVQKLQKQLTEN